MKKVPFIYKLKHKLGLHNKKCTYEKCKLNISRPHNISRCYDCPNRKVYLIELTEFPYPPYSDEPVVSKIKEQYPSYESALNNAEFLCEEDAKQFNANSEDPAVRKNKAFRAEIDGSDTFDYIIRFWDGDDYMDVKGYKIIEME